MATITSILSTDLISDSRDTINTNFANINADTPVLVYKSADETVNNSTTLQDDDELLFAVAANEVWAFKLIFNFNSGTTPDIKYAFSIPAGATIDGYSLDVGSVNESSVINSSGGGANTRVAVLHANIINSTTAGNMQIQWAQNTQDASDTTVLKGSYIIAHKLA